MSECGEDVCTTCADELRAVVVDAIHDVGQLATVIDGGETRQVALELLDDVRVGDVLLVHGGVALQRRPRATREQQRHR